ncbi:MAG: hypothetical protein HY747_00725 [Elusimicrobia bacterium]|nr:hypothetical protein [Elusimicrobiota bacterium]
MQNKHETMVNIHVIPAKAGIQTVFASLILLSFAAPSWSAWNYTVNVSTHGASSSGIHVTSGTRANDGIIRLFASDVYYSDSGATIAEYTWHGSSYAAVPVTNRIVGSNLVVGDGKNDGKNRVYSVVFDGSRTNAPGAGRKPA